MSKIVGGDYEIFASNLAFVLRNTLGALRTNGLARATGLRCLSGVKSSDQLASKFKVQIQDQKLLATGFTGARSHQRIDFGDPQKRRTLYCGSKSDYLARPSRRTCDERQCDLARVYPSRPVDQHWPLGPNVPRRKPRDFLRDFFGTRLMQEDSQPSSSAR